PLSGNVQPDIRRMNEETPIPAAVDAGISIINCGNTRRLDEPRPSQKSGGLSGPALFPQTLDNVRRLRDRFGSRIDLIATGGIDSPDKALQVLAERAAACDYFTGFIHRGALSVLRMLEDFE